MVFHPPLLYMGYVGFSVAFAFAIAALIGGRLDATWARWSRPWTTLAWSFLTCGIMLGSAWAYYELGWGGWWFWDPVENASFMPWLVGTALDSFARGHGKARHVQGVDRAARDLRLLALAPRHVPRSFGRAHVGACLRHRSAPRRVHPRFPGARHRRLARALRVAGAESRRRRPLRRRFARDDAARQQRAADRRRGLGTARHAVSAVSRRAQSRQDLRRPAVFRRRVRAADDAARLPDGRRPARPLEDRRPCPTCGGGSDGRSP